MKIAIGCDHAGPELKAEILAHLDEKGVEYTDFGIGQKTATKILNETGVNP